jgi:hypothetical protein
MIAWLLACGSGGGRSGDEGGGTGAPLEICINEVMPDNETTLADETGAYPDWIELANPGASEVSLDGWWLGDGEKNLVQLEDGLAIAAGGFLVLFADGGGAEGPLHLDFGLEANGGEVALFTPDGRGSLVQYGWTADDFAIARSSDCCAGSGCSFEHPWRGTPGESNR